MVNDTPPAPGRLPAEALIAGLGLNGLGVARSLRAAGLRALVADAGPRSPLARTRAATRVPVAALGGAEFADGLLALPQPPGARPVLILTQEQSVAAVCDRQHDLRARFRLTLPAAEVIRTLTDKAGFQATAERLGAPVPRAVVVDGPQARAGLDRLAYPCVLKPVTKTPTYERQFKKAYKVATADEARRLCDAVAAAAPAVIVQEWIEGGDADIHFVLQMRPGDGSAPVSFTGRKLTQWPPETGGTSSCVAAPEAAAELTRLTDAFFAATGVVGLCSMEFKWHAGERRFVMVEPTIGRTDYQQEIATLSGVNLPAAAVRLELGLPPLPPAPPPKRPVVWTDAPARLDRGTLPARARIVDALWRADDPGPWLATKLSRFRPR